MNPLRWLLALGVAIVLTSAAAAQPAETPRVAPQTAQESPPPTPPLSIECRAPDPATGGAIALPNVAKALKTKKTITILTIGASARGGRDAGAGGYYGIVEQMLEKMLPGLDVVIVDRGISGELAADAADRLKNEVALTSPDLVLWQLGTHDALQQVPVDAFKTTVSDTLDWLQSHNVDVVLVGLHYIRGLSKDPHYQTIRHTLTNIAKSKNVMRVGRYEARQTIEAAKQVGNTRAPDEFALTEGGYSCLSEYVARAVAAGIFTRARGPKNTPRLR